ncbi:L-threonylcarbamoyladenylate synthase, partial [Actinotignum timonense]
MDTCDAAVAALARGELVVLPTDTVYGLGADAFSRAAVTRLLTAKGRGRDKPSPVLVASMDDAARLTSGIPAGARALAAAYWPGALTLI